MTEDELETFIQKAMSINLTPGIYSLISDESPGQLSLTFKTEDADECMEFWKYFKAKFGKSKITLQIRQPIKENIDFTLMVDYSTGIVLNIKGLKCTADSVAWFFKKQPQDKPLFLFVRINGKVRGLDETVTYLEAEAEAGIGQGITIHSWNGTPFGTSS